MRVLVDTNVFLEVLLAQSRAAEEESPSPVRPHANQSQHDRAKGVGGCTGHCQARLLVRREPGARSFDAS